MLGRWPQNPYNRTMESGRAATPGPVTVWETGAMRQLVRCGLLALTVVALATCAEAQAPPASKSGGPATKKATSPGATPEGATAPAPSPKEVLATVNGNEITRGEIVEFLNHYQLSPNLTPEQVYDIAVNNLINNKLISQFLARQKVPVADKQIDEQVAEVEKGLKANNQTLATEMAKSGTSMADLRATLLRRLQWKNYVLSKATDAELKKFAEENKESLNGTQVRASHILLKLEPDASAADKEKARQKLLGIKQEIEGGKISFADAANKYSEDDINVQTKAGGDLNFFPRKGHFIEKFADAAFKLKKGAISEPVETEFGSHLIQVTDRREGKPIDMKQLHDEILNLYAADLQERIIALGRKTAKITTKELPADLFQAPPAAATPAPDEAKKTK
jgi:parvulin-like peptidyl-prolyl isomerase